MLIPRVMNFYWGGGNLSYLQYLTVFSFNKFNPLWKIVLHTPTVISNEITWVTDEQKAQYFGPNYLDELKSLHYVNVNIVDFEEIGFFNNVPEVFKSDYLRWYLLSTQGGGWSDMDILYVKPLNELIEVNTESLVCLREYGNIIGFLLSKPNNQLFKRLLDNSFRYFNHNDYQSIGSKLMNIFYPKEVDLFYEFPNTKNIHMDSFYKINHENISDLFNENKINLITDDVIGIHWYNGSSISKSFNNQYPESSNIDCTINEILKKNSMKIIGFTQLRNELSKGNLENWFKQMSVCDYIYIFDQNSDDGSLEYYKKFDNVVVIESPTNRFSEELICKKELLEKLLSDHPDVDWILWLDGDLLLDGRLLSDNGKELKELCRLGTVHKIDGYLFNHYNLWRSDIHYRIDDQYHSLDGNWCPLWRNNGNLKFESIVGLHHLQYPRGMQNLRHSPYAVVHRGFATDFQIITKYEVYKANGQNGWKLERLLDEYTLTVNELDRELLPDWFEITDDINPINKPRLRQIYEEQRGNVKTIKKNLEIISLIFKSIDYLDLIYNELKSDKCKVNGWDITLRIIANDATPEVIEKLKTLDIPYTIYNDPNPDDYYLNRVYRCWNFAGKTSTADNICFVNSDMVFSQGWLDNLLKHHNGINIPCSRLVESGKLSSGAHGVSFNCGRSPKEINNELWESKVLELKNNIVMPRGLYMPCIFETKRFIESGMYPEGNLYRDGVGTLNGFVKSGDAYYFDDVLETQYGMKHITVFDSLVYHIQEGEKDA